MHCEQELSRCCPKDVIQIVEGHKDTLGTVMSCLPDCNTDEDIFCEFAARMPSRGLIQASAMLKHDPRFPITSLLAAEIVLPIEHHVLLDEIGGTMIWF